MTEIRATTMLVGLLGWPTSHSLSPPMHNAAFEALGLDWAYVSLPTPPELVGDTVRGLRALGFDDALEQRQLAVVVVVDADAEIDPVVRQELELARREHVIEHAPRAVPTLQLADDVGAPVEPARQPDEAARARREEARVRGVAAHGAVELRRRARLRLASRRGRRLRLLERGNGEGKSEGEHDLSSNEIGRAHV